MFARMQTVNQPIEKLEALAELAREQLAAMPDVPGFRDLYYLIDRENEKALVLSFWETEDDVRRLEAGNEAMRERVKAEARLESPTSELFEVAFAS